MDVSSNPENMHNPMYGVVENSASAQDDGMYSELNMQPNVSGVTKTASSEATKTSRVTGNKRLVIAIIVMITATIAVFNCLMVAFIRIVELNNEVALLQQSLLEITGETTMQFNQSCIEDSKLNNITSQSLSSFGRVFNPAASCAAVLALVPSSPSGYYWIRSSNGSAVSMYCDMTRSCGGVTGGWMRVAELDMTNSSSQCPSNLTEYTDSNIRICDIASSGTSCSSVILPTGITYSKVCGRIQAYQIGSTDAFDLHHGRGSNPSINTYYVDGVSLTHGNPRQHIWTFAAALHEIDKYPANNCPCINVTQKSEATPPPGFVGNDYFCDTGSQDQFQLRLYSEDPLWDEDGCGPDNACCSFNHPPWFYKQLPAPITDDIEMRVCIDEGRGNENVAIDSCDIYIH